MHTINRGYAGGTRGRRAAGVGWTETRVDPYEEGTLVIDFADAAHRLVWRGSGTRRIARSPDPEQVTRRVNEAVDEILGQFPPK